MKKMQTEYGPKERKDEPTKIDQEQKKNFYLESMSVFQ